MSWNSYILFIGLKYLKPDNLSNDRKIYKSIVIFKMVSESRSLTIFSMFWKSTHHDLKKVPYYVTMTKNGPSIIVDRLGMICLN